MSDRDTAALRDSVLNQMRTATAGHWWVGEGCQCGLPVTTFEAMSDHLNALRLDAALAVTACTTCGGTGWVDVRTTRMPDGGIDEIATRCPVCHGTPPRALRWADDHWEQVRAFVRHHETEGGNGDRRDTAWVIGRCMDELSGVVTENMRLTEHNEQEG